MFGGPWVTDFGQPFTSDVPAVSSNHAQSDALMTLVAWAEGGKAPAMLVARKPAGDGQPAQRRPVRAYPALPEVRGVDATKRASFVCTDRARGTEQSPAPRYLN